MLGACVAYIHMLVAGVESRISTQREWTDQKVSEVRSELKKGIEDEASERRREHERFEDLLESFRAVGTAVTSVSDGVKHLGERFDDNRRSTDRALDEIKHGMRQMDAKISSRGDSGAASS
jgi:hypothetical protein